MDVLEDPNRLKQLKAIFCDGIFSYADEDTADRILELSLRICGGSQDVLAEVLQQKFFIDHTPFYWALLNRHSRPGIPPLFMMLLIACDHAGFTRDTQEDIMEILVHRYESEIYWLVRDKLTDVPIHELSNESYFHGEDDRPVVRTTPTPGRTAECTVSFRIPRFLSRLTVDGEVWIQFLALGALFRLRATFLEPNANVRHSRWQFEVREIINGGCSLSDSAEVLKSPVTYESTGEAQLALECGLANSEGSKSMFAFSAPLDIGSGVPAIMSKVDDSHKEMDHPYWEICALSEHGRDVSGSLVITSYLQGGAPVRRS